MNSDQKFWIIIALIGSVVVLAIIAGITYGNVKRDEFFTNNGYVQEPNQGTSGYHWTKPSVKAEQK